MAKEYVHNALTGELTIVDAPDTDLPLDEVKQYQISVVTRDYQQTTQAFVSSATKTQHTYLADINSMAKFNAEYTYVNGPDYSGEDILWLTVEAGGVLHTKDQFNRVWSDGRNYMSSMFERWDNLVKQINACTDISSVQAINW